MNLVRKLCIFVVATLLIVGCASVNTNVYKGLALSKATAESIGTTAKQMAKDGSLTVDQLAEVEKVYKQGQAANNAVITAFKISLDLGKDPTVDQSVKVALDNFNTIMQTFVDLAQKFGILDKLASTQK